MKKVIIFAVALIATFAVSLKVNSTPKGVDSSKYCKYDEEKEICTKESEGWVCYGVNEDCSWMN